MLFILYHNETNCVLSRAADAFHYFNTHLSCYFILLIAFDRYINIRPQLTEDSAYLQRLKSKQGTVILTTFFLFLSIFEGGLVLGNEYIFRINVFVVIIHTTGLIINYVLYIGLYLKIRNHYKESVVYSSENRNVQSARAPRYIRKITKTVFLLLSAMTVCYLPFLVVYVCRLIFILSKMSIPETFHFLYYLLMLPVFVNTIFNACIIMYRNKELRKYLSDKMSCIATCQLRSTKRTENTKQEEIS